MPRTRLVTGFLLVLVLALALPLAGCGSSSSTSSKPPEQLSAATAHNSLRYMLRVTYKGAQQCTTSTYTSANRGSRPITDTSHQCAKPAVSGHPILIQSHGSPEALVLDVPSGGCGRVLAGPRAAALRPLAVRCTTPTPDFRVTVLPAARRLVITGIPGAPAINFPRHLCTVGICITPLAS